MLKHRLLVTLVALAVVLSVAAAAEASCYKEGYLVFIGGTKNGATTVFGLRTSLTDPVRWDFSTDKTWMLPTLSAAMHSSSRKKVKIHGNATSCPTSGTSRFGGTINYFFLDYQ